MKKTLERIAIKQKSTDRLENGKIKRDKYKNRLLSINLMITIIRIIQGSDWKSFLWSTVCTRHGSQKYCIEEEKVF